MVSSNHTPNSGGQPVLTKEDAIQILQRLHTELDTPLFQFIGTLCKLPQEAEEDVPLYQGPADDEAEKFF